MLPIVKEAFQGHSVHLIEQRGLHELGASFDIEMLWFYDTGSKQCASNKSLTFIAN